MNKVISCVVGAVLAISATQSHAHHQRTEVCNGSEDEIMVFFVHKTGLGVFSGLWTAIGRYFIDPGRCIDTPMGDAAGNAYMSVVINPRSNKSYVGNYGTGRLNNFSTGVNDAFCVKLDGPFERSGSLQQLRSCPAGYDLIEFRVYLDLWENKVKKTLTMR